MNEILQNLAVITKRNSRKRRIPDPGSFAAKQMELAAFVDQLQARPGKSPDRLRWGAELGYGHHYPRCQSGDSGFSAWSNQAEESRCVTLG